MNCDEYRDYLFWRQDERARRVERQRELQRVRENT